MTEHSKIPVPPHDGDPGSGHGNSLIERAVEKFDLGNFKPAPIPTDIEPRRLRRRVRLPAIDLPVAAAQPEAEVAALAPQAAAAPVQPEDQAEVSMPVAAPASDPAPALASGQERALEHDLPGRSVS